MSEWKKVKLGDICETQYGFTASAESIDTGTKFLRITDIVPDTIDWESVPYCTISPEEREKYLLHKGDIVVARTGATVGYAKYITKEVPSVFASYLVRFKVIDENADKEFVGRCVSSKVFKDFIRSIANGSAQPNANSQMMSSFEFFLPSLSTQHRIATILSRYESLIDNYRKQIKLLEEAAQRLYKEWFVDLHFPGHENTKIVDGVPEGWEYRKIGDVYKTVLGGTPSRAKSNYWGGDIPWINSGEINKLRIIQASEMITQEGYDNSSTKLMPVHTTILAITGATLGQVSYTEIETCANQSVVGIIDETNQTNEYLYLYINDNILSIVNKATGGAQQHINKDIVNDYNILIPVQNVLALFKERTTPLFKLIKDYLNSIQSLTEARDRLLPKLMSGEIVV